MVDSARDLAELRSAGKPRLGGGHVKRKARVLTLLLAPAAVIGAGFAYAHDRGPVPTQANGFITCYQTTSLSGPSSGRPVNGGDPAALCSDLWTSGAITWPVQQPVPSAWTECAASGGGIDLFPTDDPNICDQLGLQPEPQP